MAAKELLSLGLDDFAFIGVDNDEQICESSNPFLSSIMPDFS